MQTVQKLQIEIHFRKLLYGHCASNDYIYGLGHSVATLTLQFGRLVIFILII